MVNDDKRDDNDDFSEVGPGLCFVLGDPGSTCCLHLKIYLHDEFEFIAHHGAHLIIFHHDEPFPY